MGDKPSLHFYTKLVTLPSTTTDFTDGRGFLPPSIISDPIHFPHRTPWRRKPKAKHLVWCPWNPTGSLDGKQKLSYRLIIIETLAEEKQRAGEKKEEAVPA